MSAIDRLAAPGIHQPIAMFASKGPMKGMELTKIILKAIVLLENAEIEVMGITSDGAATNHSLWNALGIHPNKQYIQWCFYEKVFSYDTKNILKVCPKLTKSHFDLNNLTKMKVKFASQIISLSMATGIEFYKTKKFEGFQNCEETIDFTRLINNLFDALNRKFPAEGIKPNGKDLENLINIDVFLTRQTSEGLKMTISSTIDLSNYLLNQCGFAYVLTAKMNQDCLERFFGLIRQVNGPNDHPSSTSFMLLYRLLSVYSLVKPPKTENCTILEENIPIINIADLKEIINEQNNSLERTEKIKKLKSKMDNIVEGNWDFDDTFQEHNYCNIPESTVFECIVYFLTGYIVKRLKNSFKCDSCSKWLEAKYGILPDPEAELVNMKTRGFLTHPSRLILLYTKELESCFKTHADSINVFDDTIDEFLQNINFKIQWGCAEHKSQVMTDIYVHYITVNMRQYAYTKNHEMKKQNTI